MASKFISGFSSFTDCGSARNIMLNLEYGLCFNSNTSSFIYFIGTLGMGIFLIAFNWLILFVIRNTDYDIAFQKLDDSSVLEDIDKKG